ncbi:hypothetical protein EI94DRAFT_1700075 [Lactarius quietus]|nr:hypothetical protein EI94DRAFT_1700075 [Lactarius quietus]
MLSLCGIVDAEDLKLFAESPTILHMLLDLKAHILKVESLLDLPEFKTALQEQLTIAMLSPGIPAYVTGVTPCMMTIIREQHKLFKVPLEIFDDPHLISKLDSMQHQAEGRWGGSHQSLNSADSPKGCHDHQGPLVVCLWNFIGFTGSKKPSGLLIPLCQRPNTSNLDNSSLSTTNGGHSTPTHGDHNADDDSNCGNAGHNNNNDDDDDGTAITGKHYTQDQFWNYVDDYLVLIHTELFPSVTDPLSRHRKIAWFFNEVLQVDVFNYKGGTKIPSPPVNNPLLPWQEALQRSTCCL